jgi:hypothetical protein
VAHHLPDDITGDSDAHTLGSPFITYGATQMKRLALAFLLCAMAAPAYAQTRKPLTGDPIRDIGNAINGQKEAVQTRASQGELDLVDKLQKLSLPDFQYALALAKATNNVVSVPCWQAWVDLLTAQQTGVKDAAGQPMTVPDPHVITDVERLSELLANLRPDSPISTSCAALAGAAGKDAANLIGGIMSGGALGLFKLPIPIP